MSDPTACHRKLAEACADRIDEKYGLSLSAVVRSLMSAVLASEGVVDPETTKRLLCDKHVLWNWSGCRQCEVERLEEVIADIEKAASERRQRIRDGWSVEFDRETGHELWMLDDPPLAGEKR